VAGEPGCTQPHIFGRRIDFPNASDLFRAEKPLDLVAGDPDPVQPVDVQHQPLRERDRPHLSLNGATGLEDNPVPAPDHNHVTKSFNHAASPPYEQRPNIQKVVSQARFCRGYTELVRTDATELLHCMSIAGGLKVDLGWDLGAPAPDVSGGAVSAVEFEISRTSSGCRRRQIQPGRTPGTNLAGPAP
jgi:hypothetical protein